MPPLVTSQRTLPDLLGSDINRMHVTYSQPPVEQLPSRVSRTAMLPSLEGIPARPPRHAHFGIRSVDPMHPLSTLQTPRCRDACKTRSWPVCSTLARPDSHRQVGISFPNALPNLRLLSEAVAWQPTFGLRGLQVLPVAI